MCQWKLIARIANVYQLFIIDPIFIIYIFFGIHKYYLFIHHSFLSIYNLIVYEHFSNLLIVHNQEENSTWRPTKTTTKYTYHVWRRGVQGKSN